MSKIVLENFSEGNGYYKVNLAYLNKEQVEEIESLASKWKPTNEHIKDCVRMYLTDANEQRFKTYGTTFEDCLAWLEKQGKMQSTITWHSASEIPDEQRELLCEWESEDATWHDIAFYHANTNDFWNGSTKIEGVTKWVAINELLEKQGDQEPPQVYEAQNGEAIIYSESEGYKVIEPKFKKGDWITDGQLTCKVVGITDKSYELYLQNDDNCHFETDMQSMNKYYHLWTIQDACDGDVLWHSDSASNGIFIFKEIRHDGKVLCYCDYDSEDHFCTGEYHTCCWSYDKYIQPATKKQRDHLFEKMKEAGYEYNLETKVLRKIERKKES